MTTCEPGARLVLTHGFAGEALLDGLLGEQARGDQHGRVGRVGAAGDGRDHHVAVRELVAGAADLGHVGELAGGSCLACDVRIGVGGGQRPCRSCRAAPCGTSASTAVSSMRSCGRAGPAIDGTTVARSSASVSVKRGVGDSLVRNSPCALAVLLDELDLVFAAAADAQVVEGLVVDGEEAHGRAVLGRHVGDGGAVGAATADRGRRRRTRRTSRPRRACAASA